MNPCPQDDSTTQAGALTYTTEPFSSDTTLAGPSSVGVYLASTSSDSELVATLEDIAPEGRSYPLTTGALLGSLRKLDRGRAGATAASSSCPPTRTRARARARSRPGESSARTSRCYPVFARLRKGHRLRLTLSTSVTHLPPTAAQLPGLAGGVYGVHRRPPRS